MAMSRSLGGTSLTTAVADADLAARDLSSPAIMRSSVDLPQPDGPTRTTNSPSMSVKGVLCMIVSMAWARPTVCDERCRRCSIGTGLRFCGMIELICTKALGT
jgi:hypothetical protein